VLDDPQGHAGDIAKTFAEQASQNSTTALIPGLGRAGALRNNVLQYPVQQLPECGGMGFNFEVITIPEIQHVFEVKPGWTAQIGIQGGCGETGDGSDG
jgi:hypothetical protein